MINYGEPSLPKPEMELYADVVKLNFVVAMDKIS